MEISKSDLAALLNAVKGAVQDELITESELVQLTIQHLESYRRRKIELFFENRFKLVSVSQISLTIKSLKGLLDGEGKEQRAESNASKDDKAVSGNGAKGKTSK